MFSKAGLLFLYTQTPLHAGTGASVGVVDLPIQRERITGYPLVQASGLKGCLRAVGIGKNKEHAHLVFGPETDSASEYAGALSVGDARILLFPVRSLRGVFAWTTSQEVLARLKRDAATAGISLDWEPVGPDGEGKALVTADQVPVAVGESNRQSVVLEEFSFEAAASEELGKIARWIQENAFPTQEAYSYWRQALPNQLVVLPEDAFRDFTLYATEVVNRVRLNTERKTVERGALWSEELLPAETLMYSVLAASKPRVANAPDDLSDAEAVLNFAKQCAEEAPMQLGGDETTGRGIVAARLLV